MTSLALRMNSGFHPTATRFIFSPKFGGPRCSHNITPKKNVENEPVYLNSQHLGAWVLIQTTHCQLFRMVNLPALDPYSVWTSLLPYAGK